MSSSSSADRESTDRQTDAAAPALADRQRAILDMTERQGFVTVEGLAAAFAVSAQTVPRDISAPDGAGLFQRFHGGAGSFGGNDARRPGHRRKQTIAISASREVARPVAAPIPDGAAVFLDVGTTFEAAADASNGHDGPQVFTMRLLAALRFDHRCRDVQVMGRRLAARDGSLAGAAVIGQLARLRLDFAVIGGSGIEPARVMDFDPGKVAVRRAAMETASVPVLLATRERRGRSARAEIAGFRTLGLS